MNSVRDHGDGTSSSRKESSTGIDCETHCQPVPIRVRKQTSKLTITQATRLLDAEVHELRGKINGFDPTWAGRSHGQGLNQRGDKARAIGPGRYGMGVIHRGLLVLQGVGVGSGVFGFSDVKVSSKFGQKALICL